jgi:hypothetical protein
MAFETLRARRSLSSARRRPQRSFDTNRPSWCRARPGYGRRTADDMIVDAVLRIGRLLRGVAVEISGIGFVFAEQLLRQSSGRVGAGIEAPGTKQFPRRRRRSRHRPSSRPPHARPLAPTPTIPKPHGGQQVDFARFGSCVADGDANADVVARDLGVIDIDLPVAILVEYSGVDQFIFRPGFAAFRILLPQRGVWKRGLGIMIAPAQPRRCGCAVDIPPVLLGVLSVIAFRTVQAKNPFLQEGIASVLE